MKQLICPLDNRPCELDCPDRCHDIKTAVKVTGAIRKARKTGADAVQIRPVYTVPVVTLAPSYYNTIEGGKTHNLGPGIDRAVIEVFKSLPYETQRRLERDEMGGWAERARFWQQQLKPVLPSDQYHKVMILFIRWYAQCLRRGLGAAV